jgi:hypothetical protein
MKANVWEIEGHLNDARRTPWFTGVRNHSPNWRIAAKTATEREKMTVEKVRLVVDDGKPLKKAGPWVNLANKNPRPGLTKKEQARFRAISRRLASLKAKGWDAGSHPDIEILEAEFSRLGDKLVGVKTTVKTNPGRARRARHPHGYIVGALVERDEDRLESWFWCGDKLCKDRKRARVFASKGEASDVQRRLARRGFRGLRSVMVLPA